MNETELHRLLDGVEIEGEAEARRRTLTLVRGAMGARERPSFPRRHVRADLTVTFAALKVAHVLPPASLACGEIAVADLGVPSTIVDEAEGDLHLRDCLSI